MTSIISDELYYIATVVLQNYTEKQMLFNRQQLVKHID